MSNSKAVTDRRLDEQKYRTATSETNNNSRIIERMATPQHLLAYLETSGNESHVVEPIKDGPRADEIRHKAQELRQRIGKAPVENSVTNTLPLDVHAYEKHLYNNHPLNYFNMNVWSWEPELLDDVERAKTKGDTEALQDVRKLIHAGSWDSHPPINENSAKKLAEQWHQKLLKQPTEAQLELTAVMNPDLTSVEDMLTLFTENKESCGPEAEKTAAFIEGKLREAWLNFNTTYLESTKRFRRECAEHGDRFNTNPLAWPYSRNNRSIEKNIKGTTSGHTYDFTELHDIYRRIIELRQLRDQVYIHLLYPKLCSFIKPSKKHTA